MASDMTWHICTCCEHFRNDWVKNKIYWRCERFDKDRGNSWDNIERPRELQSGCWTEKKNG